MAGDFVGSGWAFPIGVNPHGGIALASHENEIEQAIQMILLTPKGQRVMRPDFGCHVHELLFAQNDGTTAGLAVHYVTEALNMWEPRIRLLSVRAVHDANNDSRLLIEIDYEIKATVDRRSLVFPFYTIPGEGTSAT
jgi:phage baseplate assembly protein W